MLTNNFRHRCSPKLFKEAVKLQSPKRVNSKTMRDSKQIEKKDNRFQVSEVKFTLEKL